MKTINFNELPTEIQEKIKSKLSAYDKAYVEYENGEFTYLAAMYLDNRKKASDFTIYEFVKDDVFTKEEQAQNYRELSESFARMNVPDSFWN